MASVSDRTKLFSVGGDGTADFGDRYNPVSGTRLPQVSQSQSVLPDTYMIRYSDNLAVTQCNELKTFTNPEGVTSSSYRDWDLQRTKHARLALSPQQRYTKPVTSAMEYGWRHNTYSTTKRFGKVKCAETKVVDAQILGPRYVDVICPTTKLYF